MRAMRVRAKRWWPDWRALPARFAALAPVPMPLRLAILRRLGHSFGPQSRIRTGTLVTGGNLRLGRDVFINGDCFIDAHGEVTVGDHAGIGHRAQVLTEDHDVGTTKRRFGPMHIRPVTIGAGAWVGAGAIVLPGTTIGEGAIVAAGAVARGTLEPDTLYAGVPAKAIRAMAPLEPPS